MSDTSTYIRLEATGDNGYRCGCCRQTWPIEHDYDTEQELIKDCVEYLDSDYDGFTIDNIYLIEKGDGFETKRDHPNEAALKATIKKTYEDRKARLKEAEEKAEQQKKIAAYAAELAGMEDRKAFLEHALKGEQA